MSQISVADFLMLGHTPGARMEVGCLCRREGPYCKQCRRDKKLDSRQQQRRQPNEPLPRWLPF